MTRLKTTLLAVGLIAAAAPLGGCQSIDPLLREGDYNLTHANHANLVLMAANPADLVRGSSDNRTNGALAAAAVDRLETGKLKHLQVVASGSLGGGGGGD